MKKLLAIILLFTQGCALAQESEPLQTFPQPMTEQEAVMAEFAQATVMQLMCVVHYEKKGLETLSDEDNHKLETFAVAPLAHGAQHGIPAAFVVELVNETLPQIRSQWEGMSEERQATVPDMCDSTYENIKDIVSAYKEFLKEEPEPVDNSDIMTPLKTI